MDLESRIFSKFYPAEFEGKHYLSRSHAVKIAGFRPMPNFSYDFGIVSPSVPDGQRRYALSFIENAPTEGNLSENYFRGLLGESIMRIVVMEFLRQKKKELGIQQFNTIIINPEDRVLRRSENFSLEHQTRYTTHLYKNSGRKRLLIGEYDGIIEYHAGRKKGLLIMESKTGMEGKFANPLHHKESILERYCHSVQELFPEHEVDFLFMGTTSVLFAPPYRKRKLRKNFSELKELIANKGTGLLLFEFPLQKKDFKTMATRMAQQHTLRREEVPTISSNNHFVENGKYIWFIKEKRITKIFERTENNTWSEIYSI